MPAYKHTIHPPIHSPFTHMYLCTHTYTCILTHLRTQAEEDCKVLLAAINAERTLAGNTMADMSEAVAQARAQISGG